MWIVQDSEFVFCPLDFGTSEVTGSVSRSAYWVVLAWSNGLCDKATMLRLSQYRIG